MLMQLRAAPAHTTSMHLNCSLGWPYRLRRTGRIDCAGLAVSVALCWHKKLALDSTIYGYFSTLSGFFAVAVEDERILRNPMGMVRRPRVRYDDDRLAGLSRHELEKLLESAC